MQNYIQSVITNTALWQYYEHGPARPNINDADSCFDFIGNYFRHAQKYSQEVEDGLDYLLNHDPQRLRHIVSTFFLGLALYHDDNLSFHQCVLEQLRRFQVFSNIEREELDRQFAYIWFMITLFHDLGYLCEKDYMPFDEQLYGHEIPFSNSVPRRYRDVITPYLNYRHNKDYGICAGLMFDKVLCETRANRYYLGGSPLNWDPGLDEVYHHVAWMIMSHNIWWKRDTYPMEELREYRVAGLSNLILHSKKLKSDVYSWYPIRYGFHPIFFLFCLVDTIEPIKRLNTLEGINLRTRNNRISISIDLKTDAYIGYLEKDVVGMKEWLLHVRYDQVNQHASMHIPPVQYWQHRMMPYRRLRN